MSDIALRVDNLSKMYRIGAKEELPRSRSQAVRGLLASPFAYLNRMRRPPTEEETLWALRDVSFEVKHGEVLGLIGRNGAGKSTLLKILSRITDPTSGEVQVFGRVGSLLEVGTGFHPELTGRENIYLNGAILGMKRAEIDRKFDEIVDFSEIEKFLDTPVKRYSSGMYVRLAFAVAAHLEPEILLVDEVLAVGDGAFQRKCLGKLGEVATEGRTVLFVSHNMAAIQRLCHAGVYLENGAVTTLGAIDIIVNRYQTEGVNGAESLNERLAIATSQPRYTAWRLVDSATQAPYSCYSGEVCQFQLALSCPRPVRKARLGLTIQDLNDQRILSVHSLDEGGDEIDLAAGEYEVTWVVRVPLRDGNYHLVVGLGAETEGQIDLWTAKPQLTIFPSRQSHVSGEWRGIVSEYGQMQLRKIAPEAERDGFASQQKLTPYHQAR